jgi:RNA polymerase-binding transcription factor DksA
MKAAAPGKTASNSAGKAAASKKAMKPRPAVAKRTPDVEVRPLGVLPPESRAKGSDRAPAATITAGRPRPTTARIAEPSRTPGAQRLTDKDINEFEQRLLAERGRIMKEMGHLENTVLKVNQRDSSGDLSGYSFHMADAGTDAMEREKAFLFASAEGRALMEINEALRRLYNGTYGVCEVCGEPIGRARLEAMPYARLCVRDKEKEERANRSTP